MLKLCGETQERLAQELILFELTIERDVVDPLCELAEVWRLLLLCASVNPLKQLVKIYLVAFPFKIET